MKFTMLIFLFVLTSMHLSAQNAFGSSNGISKSEMKGEFAVSFAETSTKYFWAIDLTQLTEQQQSNFQNLIFSHEKLVAVSNPNSERVWYLSSSKKLSKDEIYTELIKLKEKSVLTSNGTNKYQH